MKQSKKTRFFNKKTFFFLNERPKKNGFSSFFHIFYDLKKLKDISILWNAYSVIHIIYCIIVKHYMNYIYIDSDFNKFMNFISKI